jgi:Domain of unknown function (DUF6249)
MESIVFLIPITGIVGSVLLTAFIVYMVSRTNREKREILSRERLLAIEKGMEVPLLELPPIRSLSSPLRGALVVTGLGVGLAFMFASLPGEGHPAAIGGVLVCIGVARLIHWFAGGRDEWQRQQVLDEELRRAYIERLRGGSKTEAPRAV